MKRLFSKSLSLILIAIFLQCSCWNSALAFNISEEREVGEKLLYSVRRAFPLLDDPDLVQYLNSLGKEVLDVAGIQYFDYRFYIIKDVEFNAFAAPSGLVFFYTGLIGAMNSEDELISVLAHEIGHVVKRHLASRVDKGKVIGAASIAVALAALALGGGAATQALLTGSMAASQTATLHYSRKDEEEADLLAYGWMKKLHRNPIGQKKMLDTMRRVSRYRSEKLPQYLLTHPNPEARLDYVQALIKMDEGQLTELTGTDQFEFMRFKYRIMAESSDGRGFKEYLSNVLSDGHISEFKKYMAMYGLAQHERTANNYKRGLDLLDQVIEVMPDRKILLSDKGVMQYASGDYENARISLEKAYRDNAKDLYAAFYLAKTYQMLGDNTRAEQLYTVVSYNLPEYSKVYFELGKIASQKGRNATASLFLGKYYLYEGKLKLARGTLGSVGRDKNATAKEKEQSEALLETIERLEDN